MYMNKYEAPKAQPHRDPDRAGSSDATLGTPPHGPSQRERFWGGGKIPTQKRVHYASQRVQLGWTGDACVSRAPGLNPRNLANYKNGVRMV